MKYVILVILCLFWGFIGNAQHVFYSSHDPFAIPNNKHAGRLIMENGLTLTGLFQYYNGGLADPVFRYYNDSGKVIKKIRLDSLQQVVLAGADTALSNKDSTYFIKFKNTLFRQLTFGFVKLYDQGIYLNERIGLVNSEGLFREKVVAYDGDSIKTFKDKKAILQYISDQLFTRHISMHFKKLPDAIRFLNYSGF